MHRSASTPNGSRCFLAPSYVTEQSLNRSSREVLGIWYTCGLTPHIGITQRRQSSEEKLRDEERRNARQKMNNAGIIGSHFVLIEVDGMLRPKVLQRSRELVQQLYSNLVRFCQNVAPSTEDFVVIHPPLFPALLHV